MREQLLKPMEVARKLGISRSKFYKIRPQLRAKGMKVVRVGQNTKYIESSIDLLIQKAAKTKRPLC